ncbi:MAG TPA: RuvX/YqgF family protein [Candidatus Paceibacterota bacterium]
MRLLGIDYGARRVGIAISDMEQKYAFPKIVLPNDKRLLEEIQKLCVSEEIENIVVGDSKDFRGMPNAIMEMIVPFVEKLRLATRLRVEMEPEFMTSAAAERKPGREGGNVDRKQPVVKNDMLDASAAALILQSYLDRQQNNQ